MKVHGKFEYDLNMKYEYPNYEKKQSFIYLVDHSTAMNKVARDHGNRIVPLAQKIQYP